LERLPDRETSKGVIKSCSVCAVVVTFNPGSDFVSNLNLLNSQVEHIVIVDNGSSGATLRILDSVQEQLCCTILRNKTNLGIAAALNQGCQIAVQKDLAWIATFDQDSTVTGNFIQALLLDAARVKNMGMISPVYIDRFSMKEMRMPKTPAGTLMTTLTSGSILLTKTYLRAGPFNESLFIDCVDTEYCLRLRSIGFSIVESENAILLHSQGRITFHKFLGKCLPTTNHSPSRRYYMIRNNLYVFFRYPGETSWIRYRSVDTFFEIIKILLFEKQKFSKFRFMIKGVVDYLLGRMGQQVIIS
jgi:rhamnosyltransferase